MSRPEELFFYRVIIQEPWFSEPEGIRYLNGTKGIAGFKQPQDRTLEFYGTVEEFEEYLNKRKRRPVDRSNIYDAKGRP